MNTDNQIKREDDVAMNIRSLQHQMLLSIDTFIDQKIKQQISDKISREYEMLREMADIELQNQEESQSKIPPVIDDAYFEKKPLNLNNI